LRRKKEDIWNVPSGKEGETYKTSLKEDGSAIFSEEKSDNGGEEASASFAMREGGEKK